MRYGLVRTGEAGGQGQKTVVATADGRLLDLAALLQEYDAESAITFGDALRSPLAAAMAGAPLRDAITEAISGKTTLPEVAPTELLSPIPRPSRVLAIGRNYADHARELGNAVPEDPIVFLKASTCVVGPGEAIEIPDWIGRVDFEGELLVVLGQGGKNIPESEAMECVVGYSVFNDITARERQRADQEKKQPWFRSKSMDTFGPLGPFLVTADEIPDPHDLRLTLTVNGETRQDGNTGSMIYRIPFLIAYLSRWFRLEAGDVIATGTPSGVGPLKPGDSVAVTVEKVGTLTNPVIAV